MDYGYEIPSLDLFKKITKNEATNDNQYYLYVQQ